MSIASNSRHQGSTSGREGESRGGGGDGGSHDIEGGGRDRNLRDISILIKISIMLIAQTCVSVITIHINGKSLATKVPLACSLVSMLVGFFCCMTAMLLIHRRPQVAVILGGTGSASAALGFILSIIIYVHPCWVSFLNWHHP